jgi:hypothetical protein
MKLFEVALPCDSCVYYAVINECGDMGCSASKGWGNCPKLIKVARILTKLRKWEEKETFRGYRKKVFGEPTREP